MEKQAFAAGVVDGMQKTADALIGAIAAGKGRRWQGAGRGLLYGIPAAALASATGLPVNLPLGIASGIVAGRHARGESWKGGAPSESEQNMFGLNKEQVAKHKRK